VEPVLLETPDELEPAVVEELEPVVPEELSPLVSSDPLEPALSVEPVELVPAVVVVLAAADEVDVLRASAGSCPVTSTTAITIHTAMNNATDAPSTRPRIVRTRARRSCLILSPSSEVMPRGSARRVARACGHGKNRV
jgi:hypothetical protein